MALDAVADLYFLFVLSCPMGRFDDPVRSEGVLRRLARHGLRIGGISGGVFPLAAAGLFDQQRCSVHWCYEAAFAARFPNVTVVDDVIVMEDRMYSASGAAAAFDLMLHFVEEKLSREVSTEVACWFQHPVIRGQGVRQKVPTFSGEGTSDMLPELVEKAIEQFSENLEYPLEIADLADTLHVSPRQLERKFKTATGQSPSQYYRGLRMNAARQRVLYSRDTMTAIANSVGYLRASTLVRHYKGMFGVSPQVDRKQVNTIRVTGNRTLPAVALMDMGARV
jgi:transcriptional regulator GlxA family with amidase domain